MAQRVKVLGLIPARSGSKRVKGKNIRLLNGKPLIAYTIQSAKQSNFLSKIIVSTDSNEIANIAKQFGAEVPFLRPPELAQDGSTELEFHQHALSWLRDNEQFIPDLIVNLYPTSPFRRPETIDAAINMMINHPEADSLRSIIKCTEHPYKMWVEDGEYLKPFVKRKDSSSHTLSYQLLPQVFIQNANIYITKPSTIEKFKSTIGEKVLSFIMSADESLDINSEHDFMLAEILQNKK